MTQALAFSLVPILAMLVCGAMATGRRPKQVQVSLFQHFAGGVVFAAVALELVPALDRSPFLLAMVVGFLAGVGAMLLVDKFASRAGMFTPVAVDLFVDGMLLAIGFATGAKGGVVLLIGLTMETSSLGLSLSPSLSQKGFSPRKVMLFILAAGLCIILGAGVAGTVLTAGGPLFEGFLGFGVACLLYLVTEELLKEAHQSKDTPLIAASFFVGFLLSFLLARLV
jgi:ZIP family zinc transporter